MVTPHTDGGHILILGAQGRIGAAAAQAFRAAGWRVQAQARRAGPGVDLVAPLADTEALCRAADGAHTVLYAVNPLYTEWSRQLQPLAEAGMAVAERLGAHFLLPGNVYAYGACLPPRLTPDTPQHPDTPKGRQRALLEQTLADRAAAGRLRATVLRAGDFFGPAPGTWLDKLIAKDLPAAAASGRGATLRYPGPLDRAHAWAYLPDLALAFVDVAALKRQEDATGTGRAYETLHFAGHTLTGAELLQALADAARALGVKGPLRQARMPWWPLQLAGLAVPMLRELARMRWLWLHAHALDGRALATRLGVAPPTTPLPQALQATLRAMGVGEAPGPLPGEDVQDSGGARAIVAR
jgi:nucleoside-diphosphate-sugar epimerase